MSFITSPVLNYLIAGILYLLITFTDFQQRYQGNSMGEMKSFWANSAGIIE